MVCEDILYGLDLEESTSEHWMLDIAGISASLLDTNPIFDKRKIVLAWRFLEKYLELIGAESSSKIDKKFTETIADIMTRTAYWRNNHQIRVLADKVRDEGLPVK